MPKVNKEVPEQKIQEFQAPIETKKQVVQFLINQFKDSESELLKELVQKAKELKRRLEQEEFIKKDSTINEWVRVVRKILLNKKIEKIIEQLRTQLNQILEIEQKELETKKALTHDALTCEEVYQVACLLTQFWPMNKTYVPGSRKEAALHGRPICMITLDVIDPDNRIISSTGDQFDGVALLGWLNLNATHPKSRQKFNSRDSKQIDEFAKQKGFSSPFTQSSNSPVQNETRPPARGLRLMWASLGLWALGLILGGVGVSVLVATTFYLAGALGILAGSCYMLYQAARAQGIAANNNREQERRWDRYREELDLAQALSLSLQENNNPQVLSRRNEEMDFLYNRSSSRNNAPSPTFVLSQSGALETSGGFFQEPSVRVESEVEERARITPSSVCNRGSGLRA